MKEKPQLYGAGESPALEYQQASSSAWWCFTRISSGWVEVGVLSSHMGTRMAKGGCANAAKMHERWGFCVNDLSISRAPPGWLIG